MDRKMSVMIVDDEAIVRESLFHWFKKYGHVVETASSGFEALEKLETYPYQLLFVDIKMPGMDGLALLKALRADRELAYVPVLLLSERDLVERAAATETVQAYLVKPIREADLTPTIELAAARFAEWQALRQEADNLQEALESRAIVSGAKRLLMQREGLTEHEAFLKIQHQARRERRTMRQVAEAICLEA